MKTLGIFGDSWVDPSHGHDLDPSIAQHAWSCHLNKHYQIDLHALKGNSLYWAYQKFLEHHKKYDHCIFIVTSLGRYSRNGVLGLGGQRYLVPNYETGEYLLSKPDFDLKKKNRIQALMGYYLFLQDDQHDLAMARLMIGKVRELRPDAIIVPIWQHGDGFLNELVPLSEYRRLMFNSIDPAQTQKMIDGSWNYTEIRCVCHVSVEINKLIAENMQQALELGVWNPQIPKYIEHPHVLDYYYELSGKSK